MFTNDNTNGMYSAALLNEMNEALNTMLGDEGDDFIREQNEQNYADRIMPVALEGMTAAEIVKAAGL